jgi:hypothetical protein
VRVAVDESRHHDALAAIKDFFLLVVFLQVLTYCHNCIALHDDIDILKYLSLAILRHDVLAGAKEHENAAEKVL